MIKLLIFDLDGTLFETGPAIHQTLVQIMEKRGLQGLPYDKVRHAMGRGLDHLVHHLDSEELERLGDWEALKKDFHEVYEQVYVSDSPAFPGLINFLQSWKGQLALASNKAEYYVKGMVHQSVINQFSWGSFSGGDTFNERKPHPQQLIHAMDVAQATPEETLMIGDGIPDIEAAAAAGVRSVAVTFGYDEPEVLLEKGADATISHYDQLAQVIESLR